MEKIIRSSECKSKKLPDVFNTSNGVKLERKSTLMSLIFLVILPSTPVQSYVLPLTIPTLPHKPVPIVPS